MRDADFNPLQIMKVFFSTTLFLFLAVAASAAKPLNFVLILVDDLGWMDLACQGSKYYETPHLDRLASEGMRFTDAYAACAGRGPAPRSPPTGRARKFFNHKMFYQVL